MNKKVDKQDFLPYNSSISNKACNQIKADIMKLTAITLLAAITATTASAGMPTATGADLYTDQPSILAYDAGVMAATLVYHCADERSDYAYLDFLRPITKNFTELQKPVFDVAGRITTQVMSEEVNLSCDFVVSMVEGVLK